MLVSVTRHKGRRLEIPFFISIIYLFSFRFPSAHFTILALSLQAIPVIHTHTHTHTKNAFQHCQHTVQCTYLFFSFFSLVLSRLTAPTFTRLFLCVFPVMSLISSCVASFNKKKKERKRWDHVVGMATGIIFDRSAEVI